MTIKSNTTTYHKGEWVLIRFPADETEKKEIIFRLWKRPYRITTVCDPDTSVTNVYFPQDYLSDFQLMKLEKKEVIF